MRRTASHHFVLQMGSASLENRFFRRLLTQPGLEDPLGRELLPADLVPDSLAPGLYRGRLCWQHLRQVLPGCALYVVLRHPVQATVFSYLQRSSARRHQSLEAWMDAGYLTNPQCWLLGGPSWVSESFERPAPSDLDVEPVLREARNCLETSAELVVQAEHAALAFQQLAEYFSGAASDVWREESDLLECSVDLVEPSLKQRILKENAADLDLYRNLRTPALQPQALTLEAGLNLHFEESHSLEGLPDGRLFFWTSSAQSRIRLPEMEIFPGKVHLDVEYISMVHPDFLGQVRGWLGGVPFRAVRPRDTMCWSGELEVDQALRCKELRLECPLGQFPGKSGESRRLGWAVHKVHLRFTGCQHHPTGQSLDMELYEAFVNFADPALGGCQPEISELYALFGTVLKVQQRQQTTLAALQTSVQKLAERQPDETARVDMMELLRSLYDRMNRLEVREF